jgi:RNA polymerase sigma-70 factor (ECF subfamily)
MSTNRPIARPEELLAHQGFLRGLIHSLVAGHEEVEDVLQETWAYAIHKPPRSGPGLRSWLATVARNFIRQDRRARIRRNHREAVRALPEADTGTERAIERERLRHRVVRAVLDLDEPYRTAVVLRYLDDLPPREIAKRTGAPVETVRTRIKRAMAMLRKRFDDEHGGDRRAWCMALVPLLVNQKPAAAASSGTGLLGGILLMSTGTKLLIVGALIAALLGIAYLLTARGAPDDVRPDARRAEASPPEGEDEAEAPVEEPAPPPGTVAAAAPPASRVGVSFVDSDGRAISVEEVVRRYEEAGIPLEVRAIPESLFTGNSIPDMLRMRLKPADEWAAAYPLRVGSDGLQLAKRPEPGSYRLFLGRPGAAPLVTSPFALDATAEVSVSVHLPAMCETVRVRLVERESGVPLANAKVTPLFEYGDDHMFVPGPPLRSDGRGLVRIPVLTERDRDRRQPSWWAETETHLGLIPPWSLSQDRSGQEMRIEIAAKAVVTGKAFLSNGQPAAGKEIVWMGKGLSTTAVVEEDGSFRLDPVAVWDDRGAEIILVEDLASLRVKQTRAPIVAGKTAEITIGEPAGSQAYVTIEGRVTIGGQGCAEAFVVVRTEGGDKGFVKAGADGTYRKDDVQPGRVRVEVWFADPRTIDDFSARGLDAFEMAGGEVHRFDFELPSGAFRVEVVDESTGKPIAAAVAHARPTDAGKGEDRFAGFRYRPGWGLRTGPDGTAVLLAMLPGEEHTIVALADGYETGTTTGHRPGTYDRPFEVKILLKRK